MSRVMHYGINTAINILAKKQILLLIEAKDALIVIIKSLTVESSRFDA